MGMGRAAERTDDVGEYDDPKRDGIAANIAKLPELVSPVAHSDDGKHRGQGGDNRKCDD